MEWNALEAFLKDTVWGIILLSTLGSGLLLLILNLAGRTNKGIKWLRKFYNEGRKGIIVDMVSSKPLFDKTRYKIIVRTIIISMLSIINVNMLVKSYSLELTGISNLIVFLNIFLWFYLFYFYGLIYLTFDALRILEDRRKNEDGDSFESA